MKFKNLTRSLNICATALMILSVGGNSLSVSAKHYHHKRITRRITKKHISRYKYRVYHRIYERLLKYTKSDYKRLHNLKASLKHHKYGRLHRALKKHQRTIYKSLKYHKRALNRYAKYRSNRNYTFHVSKRHYYRKPVRKTIKSSYHKKQRKAHKAAPAPSSQSSYAAVDDGMIAPSDTYTSLSASSQSSDADINTDIAQSNSNSSIPSSASNQSSDADIDADSSYITQSSASTSSSASQSLNSGQTWTYYASLETTPESLSNAAWEYINAAKNNYQYLNSKPTKFTDDTMTQYYYITKETFASALGHGYNLMDSEPSDQQLQQWYSAHNIDNNTENRDAYYWYTRDSAPDTPEGLRQIERMWNYFNQHQNNLSEELMENDGYSHLNLPVNVTDNIPSSNGDGQQQAEDSSAFNNDISNNDIDDAASINTNY